MKWIAGVIDALIAFVDRRLGHGRCDRGTGASVRRMWMFLVAIRRRSVNIIELELRSDFPWQNIRRPSFEHVMQRLIETLLVADRMTGAGYRQCRRCCPAIPVRDRVGETVLTGTRWALAAIIPLRV